MNKFTKCDVFTPDKISKLMSNYLTNSGTLLEPSVGTGNLLKYIDIHKYSEIDVYELKMDYLNQITEPQFNKYNQDFLLSGDKQYDNIILNPPYIKIQDLTPEYRKFIKQQFSLLKNGSVDIYYAFLLKCLGKLKTNGVMVAITPNSFLYNKSAYPLRKYLIDNRYIQEIIDFKEDKVFGNKVSVYCCITIFTKCEKDVLLYNNTPISYHNIQNYSLFSNTTTGKTLKDVCKITNGIATLRDKIFIHEEKLYNEPCWKPITNGYPGCHKYIIYPYNNDGSITPEITFKENNPNTYKYLEQNKEELAKRDHGKKIYPSWYAYGRSQSTKMISGDCMYIPCFINPDDISFDFRNNYLHYSCLRIVSTNSNVSLIDIQNIIKRNIDYIKNNSSKRSGGWINLSSRVLYSLSLNMV